MKMPQLDRSNYYKGLLVLARKDQIIDERERELLLQLGHALDFDRRFCEAAIDDLLKNPHISDEPVVFSDARAAECFLRDALRFAYRIQDPHARELAWIRKVARANGIADDIVDAEIDLREVPGRSCILDEVSERTQSLDM
jgi:hypothetical protein